MFGYGGNCEFTGAIVITLIGSPVGASPPPPAVVALPPAAVVALPAAAVVADELPLSSSLPQALTSRQPTRRTAPTECRRFLDMEVNEASIFRIPPFEIGALPPEHCRS